jgi:hypothetical protein
MNGHVFAKRNLAVFLMSGKFSMLQVVRGGWLFVSALTSAVSLVFLDRLNDRLR